MIHFVKRAVIAILPNSSRSDVDQDSAGAVQETCVKHWFSGYHSANLGILDWLQHR